MACARTACVFGRILGPSVRTYSTPPASNSHQPRPAAQASSSSSPSPSSSGSGQPSRTSPRFPLPSDLTSYLFRLRSLSLSTSHLARDRLLALLHSSHTRSSVLQRRIRDEWVRAQTAGKLVFGQVGGRVNEITGYDGIEKLKEDVRVREITLERLRAELLEARRTYHLSLSTHATAQKELTDLLQRRPTWSEADVERFTQLVKVDHSGSMASGRDKERVDRLEVETDAAFGGLMRSILTRYHEEQTWSDKLRSLSTYAQIAVLGVNAVLFLGAIVLVEPWKRRRMVEGFEGRVREMTEEMRREVEGLRGEITRALASTGGGGGELSKASSSEGTTVLLPPPLDVDDASPLALVDDSPTKPLPAASLPSSSTPEGVPRPPRPPLLDRCPTFPYFLPSTYAVTLPLRALSSTRAHAITAWREEESKERGVVLATGVGVVLGAVLAGLFRG